MQAHETLDAPEIPVKLPIIYSQFWRRLLAYLIDGIIASVFNLTLRFILIRISFDPANLIFINISTLALGIFLHVFLVTRFGGTPGKMSLHLLRDHTLPGSLCHPLRQPR